MKLFITTAPRQNVFYKKIGKDYAIDEYGKRIRAVGYYEPVDCEYLRYGGEDQPCCYPVIPMIHAFAEENDKIQVIVLVAPLEKCKENFELLSNEVQELCRNRNIQYTMTQLDVPVDETINTHLETFQELIEYITEGDSAYLDLTYGTKPTMYAQLLAMNYSHVVRNVFVGCVAYGEMVWDEKGIPKGKRIFDCTKLFLMDQIIYNLSRLKIKNPTNVIREIIKTKPQEETHDGDDR